MACAKPLNPNRITSPTPLHQPIPTGILRKALANSKHKAHQIYKQRLVKYVCGDSIYPGEHSKLAQKIAKDIAEVLEVKPDALGMLKEAQLGKQRKTNALANGAGALYDIQGTAALIRKSSTAGNTHERLHISKNDCIQFGIEVPPNRGGTENIQRRTVLEKDTSLWKQEGNNKIGINYFDKHGNDSHAKRSISGRVDNIAQSIMDGSVHQYHLVTNGTFSINEKQAIDAVNETLEENAKKPISYHEYVK